MLSLKVEVICAHCNNEFGVEFRKGAADPEYFDLTEDKITGTNILTASALEEMQDEYGGMFYRDVIVRCNECTEENIVKVPNELIPKGSSLYILGVPGKPKGIV